MLCCGFGGRAVLSEPQEPSTEHCTVLLAEQDPELAGAQQPLGGMGTACLSTTVWAAKVKGKDTKHYNSALILNTEELVC